MAGKRLWVAVAVVLVVSSVVAASSYGPAVDNAKERVNLAAEEAKVKGAEAVQDAKEASESWAEWVQDRVSQSFGMTRDNAKNEASNIATEAKNKISDAVSGGGDGDGESLYGMSGKAKASLKKNAHGAYTNMKDSMDSMADAAKMQFENAKGRMSEAYDRAANYDAEGAYERAKKTMAEKASQADGGVAEL